MDRTGKIILAVIALGLWVNIAVVVSRPQPATAQSYDLGNIEHDLHAIYTGNCSNEKIC
jgi:hypothetical protein